MKAMIQVKFPKLTQNVNNFPNLMGSRPCTKKDSNSPGMSLKYLAEFKGCNTIKASIGNRYQ